MNLLYRTIRLNFQATSLLREENVSKESRWNKYQPLLAALKRQTPININKRRGGRTSMPSERSLRASKSSAEHLFAARQT